MLYNLYSVRDRLNGFQGCFLELSDEAAMRGFRFSFREGSVQRFEPADFDLYRLGSFDTASGMIQSIVPELILRGIQLDLSKEV